MEKVKGLKGEKVKGLKAGETPKMTADQKACLAACKSFDADVERAKYIDELLPCVMREMCKGCKGAAVCISSGPNLTCRMEAIASIAVGMIEEGGAK